MNQAAASAPEPLLTTPAFGDGYADGLRTLQDPPSLTTPNPGKDAP
jgi:hypothetical protein